MQFIDLKTQYQRIKPAVQKRINAVLEHTQFIMGPELSEFEAELAKLVQVKHAIGVSNGTDALLIAMMALGIGPGDEIITSPFTFIATAEMILLLGAKPVFVDIDPKTYNLNPQLLEQAITAKTKLILPVSLYGQCADLDPINAIANKYNLPVLEDAAQSLGATYKGKPSGGLTTIGITSFFPSKPLGGYGEGGACFTNDDELALKMRQILNQGQERRYYHVRLGINGRLETLQAAILLAKLEVFADEINLRQHVAKNYAQALSAFVAIPYIAPENISVYAQYTIEVNAREKFCADLSHYKIPTAVHYPLPLHLQPLFHFLQLPVGSFPIAESKAKRVVSLPMHPYLTQDMIQEIANAVASSVMPETMTA